MPLTNPNPGDIMPGHEVFLRDLHVSTRNAWMGREEVWHARSRWRPAGLGDCLLDRRQGCRRRQEHVWRRNLEPDFCRHARWGGRSSGRGSDICGGIYCVAPAYPSSLKYEPIGSNGIEMIAPHRGVRRKSTQDGRPLRRYRRRWRVERLFAWPIISVGL